MQFIVTRVPFGWLIRNIHSWSANLLILTAFLHFFSVFLLKSYRRPRELTWISGVVLLLLMLVTAVIAGRVSGLGLGWLVAVGGHGNTVAGFFAIPSY